MTGSEASSSGAQRVVCSLCKGDTFVAVSFQGKLFVKCRECGTKLVETEYFA